MNKGDLNLGNIVGLTQKNTPANLNFSIKFLNFVVMHFSQVNAFVRQSMGTKFLAI